MYAKTVMGLIVQKFGGTSVADIERLKHVASIIAKTHEQGHQVVAVISAMAGVTNQLAGYIHGAMPSQIHNEALAENDVILSAGEQVTSGLLALCLQERGLLARSFLGWQIPLYTNDSHTNADVSPMDPATLRHFLDQGGIPVVAGFQGVHPNDRTLRITTLGRGGSDMTAVVLASALNADFCDIYTDVSGVFTADPRLIGSAQKIHKITFEEMQILADHGAKVLQPKCVAYAFEKNVRLRVLSSFDTLYTANEATLANTIDIPPSIGTEIIQQERTVDRRPFSGIAHSFNQAKISLVGLRETHIKHLSAIIADTHIHIEGLSQSLTQVTKSQYANIVSFLVTKADLVPVIALLKKKQQELGFSDINVIHNIVKISLVGYGFQQEITSPANLGSKIEPNLGSKVLKTLNDNQIFAEVAAITHMTMTLTADEHHARPIIQLLHDHLIRETA